MPDPRPINDVCPQPSQGHRLVDGQYVEQFGPRDPECLTQQCATRTHRLVDGAYVEHCVVPDAPAGSDANAEESQVPDSFRMGSIRLEGHTGYPGFVRSMSPIYQPSLGLGGHLSLTLPGGAQLFTGYRYENISRDAHYEQRPAGHDTTEALNIHDIHLGLEGSHQLTRLWNWGSLRVDQSDAFVLRIQNNEFSEGATAFGVERFLGASVDLSQHFSLGIGLLEYSQIGGSGPNRVPYNPSLAIRLGGNFTGRPLALDDRGEIPLRLWRVGLSIPHILRNVETTGHVTGVDGQRPLAPVLALFNAPNYGIMAFNIAEIGIDNMPNRTGTGIYGGVTMAGGLAMELAGIFGDQPALTGIGGSMFCGGAATIPTMTGSNDIWASRGTMIGCGVLQAGIGTILFFTAPDLASGNNNPLQYAPGPPSEVDPSANPHNDVRAERQVESAYQLWSVGLGTVGAGFFLTRDANGPTGGGLRVQGEF